VNDSVFGRRMSGDGKVAEAIKQLFKISKKKYMEGRHMPEYDFSLFKRPLREGDQLSLDF
jgi:hypothetical protein